MNTPAPHLDPDTLRQRYSLLCRALRATPPRGEAQPALDAVQRLEDLVHRRLLELARLGSPDDFADIYLGFRRELTRFREFCAFPHLADKTVVAFGGPFSAGKSSLINALIGQQRLVVETDPTTALPTYLLAGESDAVHALNLHHLRVPLSHDEFATLTHDEEALYGSQVSRALSAAFITCQNFPWPRLALVDTPGYTGRTHGSDRTDTDLATTQLGSAHAIVWVVSAKQGGLTEDDLAFLARLDPAIPRIVVVTRADAVPESDLQQILAHIRATLSARNLPVLGVYPASSRPRHAAMLAPLHEQLKAWEAESRTLRFAHRFKALFARYRRGLNREADATRWKLERTHRIATLSGDEAAPDVEALQGRLSQHLAALAEVQTQLGELRHQFFEDLWHAGAAVGLDLPEPSDAELLDPTCSRLLEHLQALREEHGTPSPTGEGPALDVLRRDTLVPHRLTLLRRPPHTAAQQLAVLCQPADADLAGHWLRRRSPNQPNVLGGLSQPGMAAHTQRLLRYPVRQAPHALTRLCAAVQP